MARLSRPWRLVLHRDGLLALRRLPILELAGPGVAQLRSSRRTRCQTATDRLTANL